MRLMQLSKLLVTRLAGPLELRAEPNAHYERKLRKAGSQRFLFHHGLPEHLWIMLSKKDRWLDYRDIDLKGNQPRNENGLVVDPADITAQVQGIILRGESETVEFKQEVSNDKGTSFLRTVAAFANANGGVILLGVVNGTGEVKGISADMGAEKDKVANLIHSVLVPQPKFRIQSCKVRNKDVIALFIDSGDSRPYGVHPITLSTAYAAVLRRNQPPKRKFDVSRKETCQSRIPLSGCNKPKAPSTTERDNELP